MKKNDTNLIWLDLEMTGLDTSQDKILELATIITDSNLNILAESPVFTIYQPDELLDNMDAWNTKQHTKSGLIQRVKDSKTSEKEAATETIEFIKEYVAAGISPMCGNSICQDRRFLYRHMSALERYFHYRNLDVSSIKILAKLWAPKIANGTRKQSTHRALQDIRDSIDELRYYRDHFFKLNSSNLS